jgi:hypothetical protein
MMSLSPRGPGERRYSRILHTVSNQTPQTANVLEKVPYP